MAERPSVITRLTRSQCFDMPWLELSESSGSIHAHNLVATHVVRTSYRTTEWSVTIRSIKEHVYLLQFSNRLVVSLVPSLQNKVLLTAIQDGKYTCRNSNTLYSGYCHFLFTDTGELFAEFGATHTVLVPRFWSTVFHELSTKECCTRLNSAVTPCGL